MERRSWEWQESLCSRWPAGTRVTLSSFYHNRSAVDRWYSSAFTVDFFVVLVPIKDIIGLRFCLMVFSYFQCFPLRRQWKVGFLPGWHFWFLFSFTIDLAQCTHDTLTNRHGHLFIISKQPASTTVLSEWMEIGESSCLEELAQLKPGNLVS